LHGAAVDVRDNDGANALINASEWRHLGVVRELLARGADASTRRNSDGYTALLLASWHGYAEVVRELLACGAVVNARADNGLTPLLGACQKGHLEAAARLLGAGADLALLDERGRSALRLAEELANFDDIDIIPPPDEQRREHKALVQLLRERGAM
jgi:serine/threonine-protein phosphatase 6 regulatory ankyrin repeat subunit B